MHPWFDVSVGENFPNEVHAIIEVPKGSKNKYELDKKTGLLRLDRVLFSSVHYPANYGFIPQTLGLDHDPIDILVLGQETVVPLCIVSARPIGVMKMIDQGEEDDKILAINVHDPEYSHYHSITELPPHRVREIKRFFQDYKILEHKEVIVDDLFGPEQARDIIEAGVKFFKEHYQNQESKRA